VPEKQTKAYERIKNFRAEQTDYRERFERLKKDIDERVHMSFSSIFAAKD
jgi:chromatin segregation and condensation protein Rec8/ScpA/Scc1 (kleisin family)